MGYVNFNATIVLHQAREEVWVRLVPRSSMVWNLGLWTGTADDVLDSAYSLDLPSRPISGVTCVIPGLESEVAFFVMA